MANNDFFNRFEEKITKKGDNGKSFIDESIESVKTKMKSELDAKIEGQSVINNSLNLLDTTNVSLDSIQNDNVDNTLAGQGNSQNKQRVLTKEMPGTHGVVPSSSPDNNWSFNNNNVNNNPYYGANSGSSNSNNFMGGYSNTAILLSMAVLIALVFLVSTAIIMYVGLR